MATYAKEKGFTVQTLSTDPVASQAAGGSWSSGGTMNTARMTTLGTATGSSNAFVAGGYVGPPGRVTATESYNGTAWTEVTDIPTSYNYGNGIGTNTAAVFAGADPAAATTYLWNGSSWSTPGNDLNQNRFVGGTAGTSTAGAIFGGGEPAASDKQEHWDGTSWTETTDMNTGKKNCFSGSGIQTASMCIGYPNSPFTAEVWNGSAWTEIAELSTARGTGSGAGTTTAALFSGGQAPGYVAHTETYNGTAWTELNNLSTARGYIGNGGSGSSTGTTDAIVYGGSSPPGGSYDVTEEWSAPSTFTKQVDGQLFFNSTSNAFKVTEFNIPGATWASGGSLNSPRGYQTGAGTQTAGLAIAGYNNPPGALDVVESYNGTSWSELNEVNEARYEGGGSGTQTAAIFAAGNSPSVSNNTETWNGSSWTEVNELNQAKSAVMSTIGTTTAAIFAGGQNSSGTLINTVESWNGTNWTEVNEINTARQVMAEQGTQTAGFIAGGASAATYTSTAHEQWDGTSWTETTEINSGRYRLCGSGTQTSAIVAGGDEHPSPPSAKTEFWNGTAWTEVADMATARALGSSTPSGTSSAAFVTGSSDPGYSAATEEWTASLSNFTITSS